MIEIVAWGIAVGVLGSLTMKVNGELWVFPFESVTEVSRVPSAKVPPVMVAVAVTWKGTPWTTSMTAVFGLISFRVTARVKGSSRLPDTSTPVKRVRSLNISGGKSVNWLSLKTRDMRFSRLLNIAGGRSVNWLLLKFRVVSLVRVANIFWAQGC